jgi:hypothetical protein
MAAAEREAAVVEAGLATVMAAAVHALPQPRCVYHTGSASCRSG